MISHFKASVSSRENSVTTHTKPLVSVSEEIMKDRQEEQHVQREGTYSSLHRPTVHIGDSRTRLD